MTFTRGLCLAVLAASSLALASLALAAEVGDECETGALLEAGSGLVGSGRFAEAAELYVRCAERWPLPEKIGGYVSDLERATDFYVRAEEYEKALGVIDQLAALVAAYPDRFPQPFADHCIARKIDQVRRKQMGPGAEAKAPIKLLVDGEPVAGGSAPRVVDGTLMLPPAAVKALGASVQWLEETRTARIWSESPWMRIQAPEHADIDPYDTVALGPILTLRHALSEQQWASLNQPVGSRKPILARFEIADVYRRDLVGFMPDMRDPLKGHGHRGFLIRAVLYWAYRPAEETLPRWATRLVVQRNAEGRFTGNDWQCGIWPEYVQIETVEYVVKPNDVSAEHAVAAGSQVVQGMTGWTVERKRALSVQRFDVRDQNEVLPLVDLSAQKLRRVVWGHRHNPPHPPEEVADLAALEAELRADLERSMDTTLSLSELLGNWTITRGRYSYSLKRGLHKNY